MQNHHASYTKSNFVTVICDQVCMCVCVQKACPAHLWQFQLSRPIVTIYEEDLPAKSNWSSSVALTSCMCQHKIRRFAGLSACHAGHELRIENPWDQRPTLENTGCLVRASGNDTKPTFWKRLPPWSAHKITKWSWKSPLAVAKTAVIHGLMMLSLHFCVVPAFEILVLRFLPLRHLGFCDRFQRILAKSCCFAPISRSSMTSAVFDSWKVDPVARHCDRDLRLFDAMPSGKCTYSKAQLQTNCT